MKFKVGDLVIIQKDCSGVFKNKIYTLQSRPNNYREHTSERKIYFDKYDNLWACNKNTDSNVSGCHCNNNWQKISKRQAAMHNLKQ